MPFADAATRQAPELLKHKTLWRDVLLASLTIPIVGLSTPLFTQVIIDKVVVHQSSSTLIVLGVALVKFMLFTSGMSWLRQYLELHTGKCIDAVLGSQVLRLLLRRLPLPTSSNARPALWSPACTASKRSASSSPAPPSR